MSDDAEVIEIWHVGHDGKPDFHEVRMSDETKPSPGPWRWDFPSKNGVQWGRLDDADDGVVLCVEGPVIPSAAAAALIADAWQLPQLREENREMLELLRDAEWNTQRGRDSCPWCKNDRDDGHQPDCAGAALLAKHKDKP